jgi:WD40 repeat protein
VWDVEAGRVRTILPGQGSEVATLVLTPDGLTVVAAQYDHYLKVWALEYTEPSIAAPVPGDRVDITPDGRWAVTSQTEERDEENQIVEIYDLETGDPLPSSAARDAAVQEIRSHWADRAAQFRAAYDIVRGYAKDESADGPPAVGLLPRLRSKLTRRSRPQPNLVIPQAPAPVVADVLRLWDLSQPDREPIVLSGHSSPVKAVAMTPDGRRAVSGCIGRTLRAWDLEAGGELAVLRGHRGSVWDVGITPDGRYAVSASEDRTVRVWDLHTWECAAVFTADLPVKRCAVSRDGRRIAACDALGRIHLLRLE